MKFNELEEIAKEHEIGGGGNTGFLELEEGDNKIRIVSEFEVLAKHWGAGKMLGICIGKAKGCPICNLPPKKDEKTGKMVGHKAQVKFLMHVIDRRDNQFKIGELGWTIVKAIQDLSKNEEYAFENLPPYDITIKKTVENGGKNPSDTKYTVIAARQNTDLTSEELAKVGELTPIADIVTRIKEKAGMASAEEKKADEDLEEMTSEDMEVIDMD